MEILNDRVRDICKEFSVKKLSLVGSIARGDDGPESDVDLPVEFERKSSPLRQYIGTKERLKYLFHRKVDLIERSAMKNRRFESSVLQDEKVIYEA